MVWAASLMGSGGCSADRDLFASEEVFRQAGDFYGSDSYDKAIAGYESILAKGLKSGELYYNLGNAYLRRGSPGRAIVSYERARRFMPRDSALLANYRYAKTLMKQRDANMKSGPLAREIIRIFDLLTVEESILLYGALLYGFAFFASISILSRKWRFLLRLAAAIAIATAVTITPSVWGKIREADTLAIVTGSIADAKVEPTVDAQSGFPLYEGMRVYLLKTTREWSKVKRPDGKIGWVLGDLVERVGS